MRTSDTHSGRILSTRKLNDSSSPNKKELSTSGITPDQALSIHTMSFAEREREALVVNSDVPGSLFKSYCKTSFTFHDRGSPAY